MDATLQGLDAVFSQLEGKARRVKEGQLRGIKKACLIVEGYAKENMSPESPSLPGNPPAVVTGALRASITHQVVEDGKEIYGEVGIPSSQINYARHLEFGTARMKARPFLFPALKINHESIVQAIAEELKE